MPHTPFVHHLWFIIPYLLISVSTKFQLRLLQRIKPAVYFALHIVIILLLSAINAKVQANVGFWTFRAYRIIGFVVGYNIFYLMGLLYYKAWRVKQIATALFIAVAVFLLSGSYHLVPLQAHKFPLDYVFVAYNLVVLLALCLVFTFVKLPAGNRLLQLWNQRGYTIYLYQSVVFFTVSAAMKLLHINEQPPVVRLAIAVSSVFLLSTALSYVTYPVERAVMRRVR